MLPHRAKLLSSLISLLKWITWTLSSVVLYGYINLYSSWKLPSITYPCPKRLISKEIQTFHSPNEHHMPCSNVNCFLFNFSSSCRAPDNAVHSSTQQKSKLQILQLCLFLYISFARLLLMRSSTSLSLAKLWIIVYSQLPFHFLNTWLKWLIHWLDFNEMINSTLSWEMLPVCYPSLRFYKSIAMEV